MAGRRRIDWSFGPGHGPVSGVLNAAGSALALTMVADLAGIHPVWSLAAGTFTAAAAAASAMWHRMPERVVCYRIACWMGAGLWSAWTLTDHIRIGLGIGQLIGQQPQGWVISLPGSPWTWSSVTTLSIGTVVAAFTGRALQADQNTADRRDGGDDAPAAAGGSEHERIAAEWQKRIRDVTNIKVTVVGVQLWEPYTGFTLDVELPEDGTTVGDLKRYEEPLATSAGLPAGCNVEIESNAAVNRRAVIVKVATVDATAADHHLPEDYSPRTINDDISIGIQSNRQEATINLRYSCAVLVGQTDSGKSNQLNVITTGLVRCTDAIVWAIDLSGNGRYPRPWVRAYHEGRAPWPAIDWVAPTEDEALLMVLAAIQIINGRTAIYAERMHTEGEDKIKAAPDLPEIVIVVDEMGTLPEEVKDHLKTISDTGRGAAVRTVCCALEATSYYLPRPLIKQARERIAMRVTDEEQLQWLFDNQWSRGRFDPARTPHRGSGLWATGPTIPAVFKGWRMEPARIDRASIAVAELRPELDKPSADLAEVVNVPTRDKYGMKTEQQVAGVYSGREERTYPLMFPGSTRRTPAPEPAEPKITDQTEGEPVDQAPDLDQALANLKAAQERMAAAAEAADDELPPLPEEPDWSIVESWLKPGVPAVDETGKRRPHPRTRMRQLVWDARDSGGIGPTEVQRRLQEEGYSTVYATAAEWMRTDLAADILSQPGGHKTPYFPGPKMGNPYQDH
jgi:S-DNA-T family DNA segregation ATPase FtsK/SpoIIIE